MRISGDLACFTRPEFKVERVSYPVMTPSAARGCLEAVLWKPAMRWQVEEIVVLRPIKFLGFRRNEVTRKMSLESRLFADDPEARAQRNTLALRDVAYVIRAHVVLTKRAAPDESEKKFVEMFERRLKKGQTFAQPYLGCREFAGFVSPPREDETPIEESRDLGLVLYDIAYKTFAGGELKAAHPVFFNAKLERGIMQIPDMHARLSFAG